MIALDAFFVFLAAASLPASYIWILSRWLEPEYRKSRPAAQAPERPIQQPTLVVLDKLRILHPR